MPALDNPTKSYADWCAARGYNSANVGYQSRYATYKRLNDQMLAQSGIYTGAFKEAGTKNAELNASYGGRLVTALSASKIVRNAVNWLARKNGTPEFSGSAPLRLGDGTWYGEQAKWVTWFADYRAKVEGRSWWSGAVKKKMSADSVFNETSNEWRRIAGPITKDYNYAYGQSTAGAYATVIKSAPLWAAGVKKFLTVKTPDKGLTDKIQNDLGIGLGRPAGTAAPAATGATAPGGLPWATYAIIGVVVLLLAVGAYFLFSE